jgi:hypothetical protein
VALVAMDVGGSERDTWARIMQAPRPQNGVMNAGVHVV